MISAYAVLCQIPQRVTFCIFPVVSERPIMICIIRQIQVNIGISNWRVWVRICYCGCNVQDDITEMTVSLSEEKDTWKEGSERQPHSAAKSILKMADINYNEFNQGLFQKPQKQCAIFKPILDSDQCSQFPQTRVKESQHMHLLRCKAGYHHSFVAFCSCNETEQQTVHRNRAWCSLLFFFSPHSDAKQRYTKFHRHIQCQDHPVQSVTKIHDAIMVFWPRTGFERQQQHQPTNRITNELEPGAKPMGCLWCCFCSSRLDCCFNGRKKERVKSIT